MTGPYVDLIRDSQSLLYDGSEEAPSVWRPLDKRRMRTDARADLFDLDHVPDVDLSFEVFEAADDQEAVERGPLEGVSVVLADLQFRVSDG